MKEQTVSDEALCQEQIPNPAGAGFYTCGRKVKRDGMCGIHAAAKERRAANDAAWREKQKAERARNEGAVAALKELGIAGEPHYSSISHRYTGKVVLTLENLRAAISAAKADALREAAADIPEQMRMDELALHQLTYTNQLPDLSKVMLNGATRFAERLLARAASLENEATS